MICAVYLWYSAIGGRRTQSTSSMSRSFLWLEMYFSECVLVWCSRHGNNYSSSNREAIHHRWLNDTLANQIWVRNLLPVSRERNGSAFNDSPFPPGRWCFPGHGRFLHWQRNLRRQSNRQCAKRMCSSSNSKEAMWQGLAVAFFELLPRRRRYWVLASQKPLLSEQGGSKNLLRRAWIKHLEVYIRRNTLTHIV